jgi:hypothetical protein
MAREETPSGLNRQSTVISATRPPGDSRSVVLRPRLAAGVPFRCAEARAQIALALRRGGEELNGQVHAADD